MLEWRETEVRVTIINLQECCSRTSDLQECCCLSDCCRKYMKRRMARSKTWLMPHYHFRQRNDLRYMLHSIGGSNHPWPHPWPHPWIVGLSTDGRNPHRCHHSSHRRYCPTISDTIHGRHIPSMHGDPTNSQPV